MNFKDKMIYPTLVAIISGIIIYILFEPEKFNRLVSRFLGNDNIKVETEKPPSEVTVKPNSGYDAPSKTPLDTNLGEAMNDVESIEKDKEGNIGANSSLNIEKSTTLEKVDKYFHLNSLKSKFGLLTISDIHQVKDENGASVTFYPNGSSETEIYCTMERNKSLITIILKDGRSINAKL